MPSELDYDCTPPLVEYYVDTPLGPIRVWSEALVARDLPDNFTGAKRLAYELLANDGD